MKQAVHCLKKHRNICCWKKEFRGQSAGLGLVCRTVYSDGCLRSYRRHTEIYRIPFDGSYLCCVSEGRQSERTNKAKEGWVSCGSFLFPYKALRLDSLTSLVMPEREPQRFASEVKVYTQEGTITESTIAVNRPMEIAGWNIYQLSYDESKGRWSDISVFELVRDPWLPAVYTGIIMMMLGAICLFVNAQKRKEEDTE